VEKGNYTKYAWADLSRKQRGRTMKEKEEARFAEIEAGRAEEAEASKERAQQKQTRNVRRKTI